MPGPDEELVRALRAALKENDRLRRSADRLAAAEEPIAIVGAGCRYPGGVAGPQDLWNLVVSGTDAIGPCPTGRGWVAADGAGQPFEGGFVPADQFDAGFFGIGAVEAQATKPEQRLVAEVAWEALEHAGILPGSLAGTRTGVFIGMMPLFEAPRLVGEHRRYAMAGQAGSMVSGRLAYQFDLAGPAVTVDAACASSLVAVHQAGQALRHGECTLALAGGVQVIATPDFFADLRVLGNLASDGRCKSFAAAADAPGWGEGVGVLVLERLSDARRNGRRILGLVRGSAVNQSGRSNGVSAPSAAAQRQVIVSALSSAGLTADDIDAVEGHGTGTRIGDPVEADALLEVYGRKRPRGRPLWLGSVKSNIGHTMGAGGVAGMIKMLMAMRHGVLPPTLHVDRPTPHADWDHGEISLLTEPQRWPEREQRPRRAGVTAMGISGANAHVIVEQAPPDEPAPARPAANDVPWLVSGKTEQALRDQAARLREHLDTQPDLGSGDVAWALATTRTHFPVRAAVTATDRTEALAALTALADGTPHPALLRHGDGEGVLRDHLSGATVGWPGVSAGSGARPVDLPTYAFQHQSIWLTPRPACRDSSSHGG